MYFESSQQGGNTCNEQQQQFGTARFEKAQETSPRKAVSSTTRLTHSPRALKTLKVPTRKNSSPPPTPAASPWRSTRSSPPCTSRPRRFAPPPPSHSIKSTPAGRSQKSISTSPPNSAALPRRPSRPQPS